MTVRPAVGAALALYMAALAGCGGSSATPPTGPTTPASTPAGQGATGTQNVSASGAKGANGQLTFRAEGMAIHFSYPPTFKTVPLAQDKQAVGNTAKGTHTGLAIGPYDLITVTRYPGLSTPVTAQNIASLKASFDSEVSQVLHRAVSSTASEVNGIPVLSWSREPLTGLPVPATVQIFNAFVADDEYEIQCQATAPRLKAIQAACREAVSTLRTG